MYKHYLVGAAISLVAGWLFLRSVPIGEMLAAIAQMDLIYLIPCCLLYVLVYVFRAVRWHYLMRPVARVSFRPLFAALMIGFLGNNLLPAHMGEIVRAYVLGRSEGVSKSATFATVVLERVYDGLTVLFLLLTVFLFMDLPHGAVEGSLVTRESLRMGGWLGLALFAGLLLVLQAFRWQRERAFKVAGFFLKFLPGTWGQRLDAMLREFADGLALAQVRDLGFIALYSLVVWIFLGLWCWSLFPAFGLHLSPMAGMLMEVVMALALLIPSAPAFLGTFHLAAAATLGFLGADSAVAGSYAMVLWLVHFVVTNLIGLWYLWRQGLGLASLTTRES